MSMILIGQISKQSRKISTKSVYFFKIWSPYSKKEKLSSEF